MMISTVPDLLASMLASMKEIIIGNKSADISHQLRDKRRYACAADNSLHIHINGTFTIGKLHNQLFVGNFLSQPWWMSFQQNIQKCNTF
jgi:hypothetical protein